MKTGAQENPAIEPASDEEIAEHELMASGPFAAGLTWESARRLIARIRQEQARADTNWRLKDSAWAAREAERERAEAAEALNAHLTEAGNATMDRLEKAEAEAARLQSELDVLRGDYDHAMAEAARLRERLAFAKRECIGGSCRVGRIKTE